MVGTSCRNQFVIFCFFRFWAQFRTWKSRIYLYLNANLCPIYRLIPAKFCIQVCLGSRCFMPQSVSLYYVVCTSYRNQFFRILDFSFQVWKIEISFKNSYLVHCTVVHRVPSVSMLQSWISLLFSSFRSLENGFDGNKLSFLFWILC